MQEKKIETITKLFEGSEIRSVWDSEKEDYYFSVVDVIGALVGDSRPRKYWNDLKKQLEFEGSQLSEKIGQLKMKSPKDGKNYLTDVLDSEGIFRLIESVPSPKAEPFKLWLAKLGKERIDEVFDPEIAIKRAIGYYQQKGYDDQWIKKRILSIINRKQLTDLWQEGGITQEFEYAILTDKIYETWSDMKAKEYKELKGLKKENLRDNMDEIELALTDLSEIATKKIAQANHPYGMAENLETAYKGGKVARVARDELENNLGKSIISSDKHKISGYIDSGFKD